MRCMAPQAERADHDTGRECQAQCIQSVEAEAIDDDREEAGHRAIRYHRQERCAKQQPKFDVADHFP
jgi:hypothetical protein